MRVFDHHASRNKFSLAQLTRLPLLLLLAALLLQATGVPHQLRGCLLGYYQGCVGYWLRLGYLDWLLAQHQRAPQCRSTRCRSVSGHLLLLAIILLQSETA